MWVRGEVRENTQVWFLLFQQHMQCCYFFYPGYMYNDNSIIHRSSTSIISLGYPDSIPVYVNMWKRVFPYILTPSNSRTPEGCWRTRLNSDAVCLEIALDSQVKGSILQDCPALHLPLQTWVASARRLPMLLTYGYRSKVPMTSCSGSINLLEKLTELRCG